MYRTDHLGRERLAEHLDPALDVLISYHPALATGVCSAPGSGCFHHAYQGSAGVRCRRRSGNPVEAG